MAVFELVIALLFVGAALSSVARRAKVPYPALLALAGAGLALLPNMPSVSLDPELALTLFVAPVLLDAAFDSSPRDLKQNWGPVTGLALCAVVLTVAAVAWVAHALVPAMPWSAAVALGAIVAPPDAAAATAVLKQMRLPHRLLVILEGESLFNDASALLIYRIAVASAISDTFSAWQTVPMLLVGSLGSVPLGLVLARLSAYTIGRVQDVAIAVIVQFVSTFAVWMLAERLHLSGIITVVVFAIAVARTAPDRTPARLRVPSYAVWEVAVFVLNVLAFMLVGLQLKPILQRLTGSQLARYALVAGAVCVAVVLVRIAWVCLWELLVRWTRRRSRARDAPSDATPKRAAVVIAWSGMRGIVTLATALALPIGSPGVPAFPERDLILFTAFSVVLFTLVFQGMSLDPLIRLLSLDADGSVEREIELARRQTIQAGLQTLTDSEGTAEDTALLRRKYEARLHRAETLADFPKPDAGYASLRAAQLRALGAERKTLSDLRARGVIGDDAFHRIEEELDWAELSANAQPN
jgi:CPA1 family monovalent cation:H+ antiporter